MLTRSEYLIYKSCGEISAMAHVVRRHALEGGDANCAARNLRDLVKVAEQAIKILESPEWIGPPR